MALWPEYTKGADRRELGKRLDLQAVYRVAKVEPELAEFLIRIGLVPLG
jgi:hypothetical protein